ncbi:MAG TPA: hypothetical protein PKY77_05905 [Phycisphaerae bacterium]|nr:hypothetical protein [Phycisphaerae bacterium]HRY69021.1 hypothetical protein [Phycisphaerae bacterium]HSA26004.1 hypothetical protein [Phycisphaerae bacterium]
MCKQCSGLRGGFSRRDVLLTAASTGLAGSLLRSGVSLAAGADHPTSVSAGNPTVMAVFLRPREKYWLGWPGTAWDVEGFVKKAKEAVARFAGELKVDIKWEAEPLYDDAAVDAFVNKIKQDKPQGVLVFPLHMEYWGNVGKIAKAGEPTLIFAPLGICFTGHIQTLSRQPKVYLASCGDFEFQPVRFALKMVRANHDIRHTKVAVLVGKNTGEQVLEPLGLSIRHLPRSRFPEVLKTVELNDEVRAIVDDYKKSAAKIVEPGEEDLVNAAKNYVTAAKIMAEEGCQGISLECLGLVVEKIMTCPPCMAWSKLLDAGVSATCEADVNAVMSQELCLKLLGKPGFVQDPVPNTVDNTFIGAHCVCATRLNGPDKDRAKFILRSHSESNLGVSVQVIWPVDTEVTIMQFVGPGKMILGQGKVLRNFDTPPAGGCRTSVELAIDGPADTRDTKGFHQLFIAGKHMRDFQAYGQLYGIATEHI